MSLPTPLDLDLPGGSDARGNLVSIRALMAAQQTPAPGQWLDEMSAGDGRAVVIARLQRKPDFSLQVGAVALDCAQAQREVEAGTALGKTVDDLERREVRLIRQRTQAR